MSEVIARYVAAAMPIAQINLQQGELIAWPTGRWTREGSDQYRREEILTVSWGSAIDHRAAQLHALPEYQDAVATIRSNADWSRQFDTLVGTSIMRSRLDLTQFVDDCLARALAALAEPGRDPIGAALQRAQEIETFLNSDQVEIETFAPLLGMRSFGLDRVELGSNLSLVPVDETELERLHAVGLLSPSFPRMPFYAPPSHTARFVSLMPKVVGEVNPNQPFDPLDDPAVAADEAMEELISCLRLFRGGLIAVAGKASTMPGPFGGFHHRGIGGHPLFGGRMVPPFMNGYFVPRDAVPVLQALWAQMHTPGFRASKQLALAVRRFAYKGERSRADDQLVDLVVAAEALFLGDIEDERGELRFRMSSRAATYVRHPTRGRRSIYQLFSKAYLMRSQLLHGREARTVMVEGSPMTLERMVEEVEALLRIALNQAVAEASSGSKAWQVDWERLLFPDTGPAG